MLLPWLSPNSLVLLNFQFPSFLIDQSLLEADIYALSYLILNDYSTISLID